MAKSEKSIPTIAAAIDPTTATVSLTFSTGHRITVRGAELDDAIRAHAFVHGIKQKLVDAAAIARNPDTGKSASVLDKYNAVLEVAERLRAGEWNKTREGVSTGGLLFAALCEMMEGRKSADEVKEWLDAKSDAEKLALRKNDKVAAIILRIQSERLDEDTIDRAADLLDDLENG